MSIVLNLNRRRIRRNRQPPKRIEEQRTIGNIKDKPSKTMLKVFSKHKHLTVRELYYALNDEYKKKHYSMAYAYGLLIELEAMNLIEVVNVLLIKDRDRGRTVRLDSYGLSELGVIVLKAKGRLDSIDIKGLQQQLEKERELKKQLEKDKEKQKEPLMNYNDIRIKIFNA